jgi:hypothetical protein
MNKNTVIRLIKYYGTRNCKNWTVTDRAKLRRMYRSGRLTVNQIAERLDRTYYSTIKQASRLNLAFKRK